MSTFFLGGVFYSAGVSVLNPFTDETKREFWFDPERIDAPDDDPGINPNVKGAMAARKGETFYVETMSGLRTYNTSIDADRAKGLSVIRDEEGMRLLTIASVMFCSLGVIIFGTGIALRWLGIIDPPTTKPDTPVLFDVDRLDHMNRVGLFMVVMGAALYFFGGIALPVAAGEFGVDYQRGQGIDVEFARLFWPMMILDKIAFISVIVFVVGLAVIAAEQARRRGWVDQMAWGRLWYESISMVRVNWVALASFLVCILAWPVGSFHHRNDPGNRNCSNRRLVLLRLLRKSGMA